MLVLLYRHPVPTVFTNIYLLDHAMGADSRYSALAGIASAYSG